MGGYPAVRPEGTGHEFEPRDPARAEITIAGLDQCAGFVLEQDGGAGITAQRHHGAGRGFLPLHRLCHTGDVRPGDLGPVQQKSGIGKTGTAKYGRRLHKQGFACRPSGPAPGTGDLRRGAFQVFAQSMSARTYRQTIAPLASSVSMGEALLHWYDSNRRDLPWRARPGMSADPYRVWISEIMLQQTTVAAVRGYFDRFVGAWPNLEALAAAPLDEVLAAWAGLGYYARARNLHRGAQFIMDEFGGRMPRCASELIRVPGIGPYTANAIAAIAFGEEVVAIDTNAERVLSRLFAFESELPAGRNKLALMTRDFVPAARPGDFAQALMDLGSAVCVPGHPQCGICPLSLKCEARRLGIAAALPRKKEKRARRTARAVAFVAIDAGGSVYLVKRPQNGLFGGMMQPPLTELRPNFPRGRDVVANAPFRGDWKLTRGQIRHTLTHIELEIRAYVARFGTRPNGEGIWLSEHEITSAALPTAMRKIIAHATR